MGKKIFTVLAVFIFACTVMYGQKDKSARKVAKDVANMQYIPVRPVNDSIIRAKTIEDLSKEDNGVVTMSSILAIYKPFVLPPIDEIFERAKRNPDVLYRKEEMDVAWRAVATARRVWMSWFRANAGYSYGKYNTNLFYQQTNIPTSDTYSSSNSSYYLVGGSVSINLYDLWDLDNKVKSQKAHYNSTAYQYQAQWEGIMEKITKSYYTVQSLLPTIPHAIQWAKLSEMAYEDIKLDFIAGRATTASMFAAESNYYRAIQELSVTFREINVEVKYMELMTNSKIIPDEIDSTSANIANNVEYTEKKKSKSSVSSSKKTRSQIKHEKREAQQAIKKKKKNKD